MKTLIVKYLPNKRSRTKKLLDAFLEEISDTEIEELDLCNDVPDLFSFDALEGYFGRISGAIPGDPHPNLWRPLCSQDIPLDALQ